MNEFRNILINLQSILDCAIIGQPEAKLAELIALASGYGCLLIGEPGTGKSRISEVLARAIADENAYCRVQGTVDLTPSGVIGGMVYDPRSGQMTYRPGPVNEETLVAHIDEINRIPEMTQAVFLPIMEERRLFNEQLILLDPALTVVGTMNEADSGSFPLIRALLDRFAVSGRMTIGSEADRVRVLRNAYTKPSGIVTAVNAKQVAALREYVAERKAVALDETLNYIISLVDRIRSMDDMFVMPRSASGDPEPTVGHRAEDALLTAATVIAIRRTAKSDDENYSKEIPVAEPADVRKVAVICLQHRLTLSPAARSAGRTRKSLIEQVALEVS